MAASLASTDRDLRGYPERTFPTRILQIDPSKILFKGKERDLSQEGQVAFVDDTDCETLLKVAAQALADSHLVAFPTETVYGLGANALDEDAVVKIFRAKGRPTDNPLIVHISDMDMLRKLVLEGYQLSAVYDALIRDFWPGPMTLLFPVDEVKVPSVVRCGLKTLGVRMPSHPVARALIAKSKLPLAAPSANASGRPSPTTAMHVYRDMTSKKNGNIEGRLPYIIDGGPCLVGLESTVIDGVTCQGELRVLRPGGVGVEALEHCLQANKLLLGQPDCKANAVSLRVYGKDMQRSKEEESAPTTPGMKYRHYSPDAEVILLLEQPKANINNGKGDENPVLSPRDAVNLLVSQHSRAGNTLKIGLMSLDDSELTNSLMQKPDQVNGHYHFLRHFSLGSKGRPEQVAKRLFEGLRALDEGEEEDGSDRCELIFVEAPNDDAGIGLAIMNRLEKAASSVLYIAL